MILEPLLARSLIWAGPHLTGFSYQRKRSPAICFETLTSAASRDFPELLQLKDRLAAALVTFPVPCQSVRYEDSKWVKCRGVLGDS